MNSGPYRSTLYSISLALILLGVPSPSQAEGMTREVARVQRSADFTAGTEWFSPAGKVEACNFDFNVVYDDITVIQDFGDHATYHLELNDTYTNLATGFSFLDKSHYSIYFDYSTGLAQHRGSMWTITIPGQGVVVHDTGRMLQDWFNWPTVLDIQGKFDINRDYMLYGSTSRSYCNFMSNNFN